MSNVLELIIIAFPIYLVSGLQMQQATKLKIITSFLLRLPYVHQFYQTCFKSLTCASLIPVSILRLVSMSETLRSNIFLFDYVTTEIWTQAEMCFTILSATIPCLRIFLAAAQTGLLDLGATDVRTGEYSKGGSGVRYGHPSRSRKERGGHETYELRSREDNRTVSKAMASRGDNRSIESGSSERAIMVRHTVDVQMD